jgi:predicted tellurium resistance membrane protein TerC
MHFALPTAGAIAAFFQVVLIDLALAGDNAIAVGLCAAGLPQAQRRRAIVLGLAGAVVMLICFALITTQLLKVVGPAVRRRPAAAVGVLEDVARAARAGPRSVRRGGGRPRGGHRRHDRRQAQARRPAKTMGQALLQILIADLTMSLDNVLACAGAAREHPGVLVVGLLLSITLMGVAASWIAKLLHRFRWIGYVGLVIILMVAGRMIWEGSRDAAVDLNQVETYNAVAPDSLDITPADVAERKAGH